MHYCEWCKEQKSGSHRQHRDNPNYKSKMLLKNFMKILSLFDGLSGARVALERAGIPVEVYYASEIDRYALIIAQKNYPDTIQLGDVSKLGKETPYPKELLNGGCDLIVFGFPCTDLSIAKKNRQGLKGEASGLFYEAVRIIKELKPKYFLAENVFSMSKENRAIVSEALGVEGVMVNAALVSAQNRKRIFWANWKFTQPEDRGILLKDILEKEVDESFYVKNKLSENWNSDKPLEESKNKFRALRVGGNNPMIRLGQFNKGGQGDRIYSPEGKSVGLSALGGGRGAKTGLYCISSSQKHATITEDKSSPLTQAMGTGGGAYSLY